MLFTPCIVPFSSCSEMELVLEALDPEISTQGAITSDICSLSIMSFSTTSLSIGSDLTSSWAVELTEKVPFSLDIIMPSLTVSFSSVADEEIKFCAALLLVSFFQISNIFFYFSFLEQYNQWHIYRK